MCHELWSRRMREQAREEPPYPVADTERPQNPVAAEPPREPVGTAR